MSELNMTLRRQGVTGSEIAKVAGVSRYGGPLEVWARKLGHAPEQADNPQMARGRHLEPALCAWAADEVGLFPVDVGTLQSMSHPLIIASPDRLLYRDPTQAEIEAVLEVKSPRYTTSYWTHPDEDPVGIDPQYLPQVTWEMAAAGVDKAVVGALCYGELWIYRLTLDHELQGLLTQAAERFWRNHVLTGRPPAPSTGADAEVLRRLYPASRAPLVPVGIERADIFDLVGAWRKAESDAKHAAEDAARLKADVLALIGEAEGLQAPDWRVTWKANKPSRKTDWQAVAESLADWAKLTPQALDNFVDACTTEHPGARVLRYTDLTKKAKKGGK